MADPVKINLSAHHQGHKPGEQLDVDPAEARRLIGAGVAVPATKPAARKIGVDEASAATVQD